MKEGSRSDFADHPVPVPVAYHPMTHTVSVACAPLVDYTFLMYI